MLLKRFALTWLKVGKRIKVGGTLPVFFNQSNLIAAEKISIKATTKPSINLRELFMVGVGSFGEH